MQILGGKPSAQVKQEQPAGSEGMAAPSTAPTPAARDSVKLAELACTEYRHVAPEGAAPEQVAESGYWRLFGDDFHSGDSIKVLAHNRAWLARVEIIDSQPGHVTAALAYVLRAPAIREIDAAKKLPEGWRIERTGPDSAVEGWIAVGPKGKKILNSGLPFATHEEARRGLLDHAIFAESGPTKYVP